MTISYHISGENILIEVTHSRGNSPIVLSPLENLDEGLELDVTPIVGSFTLEPGETKRFEGHLSLMGSPFSWESIQVSRVGTSQKWRLGPIDHFNIEAPPAPTKDLIYRSTNEFAKSQWDQVRNFSPEEIEVWAKSQARNTEWQTSMSAITRRMHPHLKLVNVNQLPLPPFHDMTSPQAAQDYQKSSQMILRAYSALSAKELKGRLLFEYRHDSHDGRIRLNMNVATARLMAVFGAAGHKEIPPRSLVDLAYAQYAEAVWPWMRLHKLGTV